MDILNTIEDYRKITRGVEIMLQSTEISVGTTPSEVVYTEDDMKLLHYRPTVEKPYPVPVLIVHALVNRYYIMDLHPEKVKNLVTLVTPVNFDTDKGLLHIWSKSLDVDKIVDYYGIVPGDLLNAGFLLTDPFRLAIDKYAGLFSREWKNGYSTARTRQARLSDSSSKSAIRRTA